MFHSFWVHLGPFRYSMKLGAKWAELVKSMQKFFPRSRVQIFRNQCTRSTLLDPKLLFFLLRGTFGTVPLLYDTRFKTGWIAVIIAKSQAISCVRIFCNKSTLSTPGFSAFHSVWVHLGPFHYCMKLGAKWVEVVQLIQKFVPRSRIRCFCNERIQSTPWDL